MDGFTTPGGLDVPMSLIVNVMKQVHPDRDDELTDAVARLPQSKTRALILAAIDAWADGPGYDRENDIRTTAWYEGYNQGRDEATCPHDGV